MDRIGGWIEERRDEDDGRQEGSWIGARLDLFKDSHLQRAKPHGGLQETENDSIMEAINWVLCKRNVPT